MHIIAVSLSFFLLSSQALDSLAPARLEFSKLCQTRAISSAFKKKKKKLFKGLEIVFSGEGRKLQNCSATSWLSVLFCFLTGYT